jgi:two-component system, NarL family, sensor kinase
MSDVVLIALIVLFIFIITVFIVLFIFIYHRRQVKNLQEKKLLQSQHAQAILQTQLEIQEQTLNTVAQEIHDNIGQILGLAKLNLNNLIALQPDTPKLTATKDLVAKAINDLRNLTRSLHGGRIADLGLPDALAQELQTLQNTGQFTTRLQTMGKPYRLEAQHEMVLFRMVQEALHNAIKHSEAKHIKVELHYEPQQFILSVTDDGKGFDPAALAATQKGIGLKSMENRAALIGAAFSINTAIGQGTNIMITLPKTTDSR